MMSYTQAAPRDTSLASKGSSASPKSDPRADGPGLDLGLDAAVDGVIDGLVGDVRTLQLEVLQLRKALVSRACIDQAKGIIMARNGLDADIAFRVLQQWSSVTNIRLAVLAEALVTVIGADSNAPTPQQGVVDQFLDLLGREKAGPGARGDRSL